jgi:copper chaperone NosL
VLSGVVGLCDFYLWEYDYGHDLDPHAAIKIADMNYQPPVLGTKQLLNFTAYSYPDIGGIIIMGSAMLAFLFVFVELRKSGVRKTARKSKHSKKSLSSFLHKSAAVMLLTFILTSCSVEPQPIKYGEEQCTFCKMTIADSRFGCELLTKKGKAFKFDSNECMIKYIAKNDIKEESISMLLATDYSDPGKFVDAKNAFYIIDSSIQSPMGANLAAFSEKNKPSKYETKILNWGQAFQEVSTKN